MSGHRHDVQGPIHKALRRQLTRTLNHFGAVDVHDEDDLGQALAELDRTLAVCRLHLGHESRHIHPAMEAVAPGSSEQALREHHAQRAELAALAGDLRALRSAAAHDRDRLVRLIYRSLARCVADQLLHMAHEEKSHNAVLWAHYDDAALQALEARIAADTDPAAMQLVVATMRPALNPAERAATLAALQAVHPTPLDAATPHPPSPESPMTHFTYDEIPTQTLEANGVRYAFRRFGAAQGVPLVFFQRFRGTMDHWDPALLEGIARERPVIVFDNAGVGASTGEVPADIAGAARRAASFIDALGLPQIDALGWSMGGTVVQRLALDRPALVRRLVLAGTGPGGVAEAPRAPDKVWQVAAKPVNDDEDFLYLFFTQSPASRQAGRASLRRLDRRLAASKAVVRPESWKSQAGAIAAWGLGQDCAYPRLAEITAPVLVANGMHDVMVHAYNSYAMAQRLPNAHLVLYPDAGHGFLFQYPEAFARQVLDFLR